MRVKVRNTVGKLVHYEVVQEYQTNSRVTLTIVCSDGTSITYHSIPDKEVHAV